MNGECSQLPLKGLPAFLQTAPVDVEDSLLGGKITVTGDSGHTHIFTAVDVDSLAFIRDGKRSFLPLRVSGNVDFDGQQIWLRGLTLKSADSSLTADGMAAPSMDPQRQSAACVAPGADSWRAFSGRSESGRQRCGRCQAQRHSVFAVVGCRR